MEPLSGVWPLRPRLGLCAGQLAARSAAFWALFRLLRCGGSAGAAQVVCVCPGCLGRESAGGLSQALATGEDLGARGDCGLARVDPGSRFIRGNFISCKPCYLHKITECCCQWWTELVEELAVEEVVGDAVAARAAGAMVRIFACPRRVAFQPHADEPALLVRWSVAHLAEPGPCSRVGKVEVPLETIGYCM